MVTQIQLGNIFQENGRTVVGGTSSGIDTQALVKGLTDAKRLPAVTLEKTIASNTKISSALGDLKDLVKKFQDAANFLRNPPGVGNAGDDIFKYRTADITSNSSVAGSTYIGITAEPGTSANTYDIKVNQLATNSVYTTNTFALTDTNTAVVGTGAGDALRAGPLALGASGTSVTLNNGDTLSDVINKINAVKDTSGVEAVAIKVATGQYRLSLKTLNTGADQNYTPTAATFSNVGFAISTAATDASIDFDGTTITRHTNSLDDVVTGVTFNLLQATPSGTDVKVAIKPDTTLVKNGISNFVNAYNELRFFAARQTEVDDSGKPADTAVLYGNSTLSLSRSQIESEISGIVKGVAAGDPSRLADLGITFADAPKDDKNPETKNILVVDEAKLDSAISSNFNAVQKVFEFDYSSDNSNLQVFQRTNGLGISAFKLNVNQTTGVYQASYDDDNDPLTADKVIALDGTPVTSGTGVVLKGQKGTVLDGLTLIYNGTDNPTINVNISQGIGDRLYNAASNLLDESSGAVAVEITSLADKNTRIQKDIDRIDDQVNTYRDRLLNQYAALESSISQANNLLASLDAQSKARNQN